MKRLSAGIAFLALALSAGAAGAVSIGVGAFGGVSVPIVQDDTDRGTVFGARVPVDLVPLIAVEPYFAVTSGGSKDETFAGSSYTRSGLDVTAFGANVLLQFGSTLKLFPFAGIGSHKLKREGAADITQSGYNFGLGLGFSPPVVGLSIDVRGELNAVVDGDVSRKWANATVGVSYNVLHLAK